MLEELCEQRESHAQQLRRNGRQQLIHQKRMRFLDMSDLLLETQSISSNPESAKDRTLEQRLELLLYGSYPDRLIDEADDYLYAMMMRSESNVLGEKCKCTSDLTALFLTEDYHLDRNSMWIVLRTCVNLVLRAPKIDYQLCAGLLSAIVGKVRSIKELGEVECIALIKCLEAIPAIKRTQIFGQHRRLLQFIVELLLNQSAINVANRLILYVDTIFSGCDQESRDILLQNINLIKVLCESLITSPQTVDSVLIALSNIALNGSDMVEFLSSVGLIRNLMTIFEEAKPSTKHLVVVVFYNLILSSNDDQIVQLCQQGLMYLIEYCMVQPINLQSLQLSLKILQKLVTFVSKRYQPKAGEVDPRIVLLNRISVHLKSLTEHSDEFVRDVAAKIQEALGCPQMDVQPGSH